MRDLTLERNIARVIDGISGDVHEFFYRTPTLTEREAYEKAPVKRKGRKIVFEKMLPRRVKFAKRIVTGFKKGTFGADGKPFSSDPDDPDYRPDWLALIEKMAPECLAAVAQVAFEGTRAMTEGIDLEVEEDEGPPQEESSSDPLEEK